ncbi:MAG: LysR family transcriptional regulator [Alphaproteobacteria bacterium]|nr:LysR family transcriptional regulator [Alphaproteobacteria bacterium]
MSTRQLLAFDAVAQNGSFSAAARRLGVTHPAVTLQVRALEKAYKVRLFKRRGDGIALTDTGRRIFALTRQMFEIEARVRAELSSIETLAQGELTLASDSPQSAVDVLAVFQRRHPAVRLSVSFANSTRVWQELAEQRVDAVIAANPPPDDRIAHVAYRRESLVALVPNGHRLADRRTVSIRDLRGEAVIAREPESGTQILLERVLVSAGVVVSMVMRLDSREAVHEAVAQGLGVGFGTDREAGWDERFQVLRVKEGGRVSIDTVACLKTQRGRAGIDALMAVAREIAARRV